MSGGTGRWGGKEEGRGFSVEGIKRSRSIRPALGLGAVLAIGLIVARLHAGRPHATVAPAATLPAPTQFTASFTQAQREYLHAQVIAKRQLEAVEEWDSDALRGSAPEIYRRELIARTREIEQAEAAAREAVGRAQTADERYRATRLLAHIECDRGRHRAELALARTLAALRPRHPEPLLLVARAAVECGDPTLARRAMAEAEQMPGLPPTRLLLPAPAHRYPAAEARDVGYRSEGDARRCAPLQSHRRGQ